MYLFWRQSYSIIIICWRHSERIDPVSHSIQQISTFTPSTPWSAYLWKPMSSRVPSPKFWCKQYPFRNPSHINCSRISLESLQNELTHFLQGHSILSPTAKFLNAKDRKLLTPCKYAFVCLASLLIHDLSMSLCGDWACTYSTWIYWLQAMRRGWHRCSRSTTRWV